MVFIEKPSGLYSFMLRCKHLVITQIPNPYTLV